MVEELKNTLDVLSTFTQVSSLAEQFILEFLMFAVELFSIQGLTLTYYL